MLVGLLLVEYFFEVALAVASELRPRFVDAVFFRDLGLVPIEAQTSDYRPKRERYHKNHQQCYYGWFHRAKIRLKESFAAFSKPKANRHPVKNGVVRLVKACMREAAV